MSHNIAKSHSQFGSDSSDKGFPLRCMKRAMSSLSSKNRLRTLLRLSHLTSVRLRADLLQEQLELTVIEATRPNEIYCFHDRGHYIIHPQQLPALFDSYFFAFSLSLVQPSPLFLHKLLVQRLILIPPTFPWAMHVYLQTPSHQKCRRGPTSRLFMDSCAVSMLSVLLSRANEKAM